MSRENSGCKFDIVTGGAKGYSTKNKPESHAVVLSLNAIGIGTLGGVPRCAREQTQSVAAAELVYT